MVEHKYPNLDAEMAKQRTTQAELAKAIGVSEVTVGSWVRGVREPGVGKAMRVANYFGKSVSYIFAEAN